MLLSELMYISEPTYMGLIVFQRVSVIQRELFVVIWTKASTILMLNSEFCVMWKTRKIFSRISSRAISKGLEYFTHRNPIYDIHCIRIYLSQT